MHKISIDFETYSECDLKTSGAWVYSRHPSTEVLCMAYSIDGGEPQVWVPGEEFPGALWDVMGGPDYIIYERDSLSDSIHIKNYNRYERDSLSDSIDSKNYNIYAWNAFFEIAIWENVCKNKYGWGSFYYHKCGNLYGYQDNFIDSMAVAAYFGMPLALDRAAKTLGTKYQKDASGTRLLNKFSIPKKDGTRNLPQDHPEDFQRLINYCKTDVLTEMDILSHLPKDRLPASEQKIWEHNLALNLRGIPVDIEFVKKAQAIIDNEHRRLEEECLQLTGFYPSQVIELAKVVGLPNLASATVGEALSSPTIDNKTRKILEIRKAYSLTSIKKYQAILNCVTEDGRIHGVTVYHGAATGRFAGRMVQLQNLPRGTLSKEDVSKTIEGIKDGTIVTCSLETLSCCLRGCFIPSSPEKELFVSDFSSIECCVLAWMAGQNDLVEQFRRKDDVYVHMAAAIFNKAYEDIHKRNKDKDTSGILERFVGKQSILGCGYGMGADKFKRTCAFFGEDISQELALKTIQAYRSKNKKIVAMWYALDKIVRAAITTPKVSYQTNLCTARVEGDFLFIKLPSGRCLSYYNPIVSSDGIEYTGYNSMKAQVEQIRTYGGRLVENVVQAVARDLLVHGMGKVERSGYKILTTVHDEIIAERTKGEGSVEEFTSLMASLPVWASGCPVEAEGWKGERYGK